MASGRVLAVSVAASLAILAAGCSSAQGARPRTAPADRSPSSAPCGQVLTGAVPEWARTGFSGSAEAPHVVGERGEIVAVMFGGTLHAPPLPDKSNKVLWVSKAEVVPLDPLRIEARLGGNGPVVRREVPGGPGPSTIDLPSPGCWQFTLRWSGRTDTMRLSYLPG